MRDAPASGALGRSISSLGQWVGQALGVRGGAPQPADPWALWQAARAGDQASASALVRRLSPQAYALAMQLLGRREDAEDMVQEAFLRLWRARASDAHGASLATYFNTIVINRCKSWLARRRELSTDPEQLLELADASQGAEPPGTDALAPISTAALAAAMARLSPRQRMALAMWAYADADVPAIARALELDANAAHQLLHRAKAALRQHLKEPAP